MQNIEIVTVAFFLNLENLKIPKIGQNDGQISTKYWQFSELMFGPFFNLYMFLVQNVRRQS